MIDADNRSRATFEGWVQQATDVFEATLMRVGEGEPFDVGSSDLYRRRFLEHQVRVERVVKGSLAVSSVRPILQRIRLHLSEALASDDIGEQFLFVARRVAGLQSDDQSRSYDDAIIIIPEASYKRILVNGDAWGVRLESEFARQLGNYGGDRATLERRLREGKRVRKVDGVGWEDLIRRTLAPTTVPSSDQLGADEVEYYYGASPEPETEVS